MELRRYLILFALYSLILSGTMMAHADADHPKTDSPTVGSQSEQANQINWNTIILAFISSMTTIATAAIGVLLLRVKRTTDDTHTLVNSQMGVQLLLGRDLAEFKAATTNAPEDIAAATLARHRYEEHIKRQAVVDARSA